MDPEQDVKEILYTEEEISEIVDDLAARISEDYKGKDLVVLCILKGASIFFADLIRRIKGVNIEVDFMKVASYGSAAQSSGTVRIIDDTELDLEGKDVLVVEDIYDTGLTLKFLAKNLASRNPNSVELAVFIRKDLGIEPAVEPKYLGVVSPNAFLVGYGLDYNQHYRQFPYVGILDEKVYS